MDFEIICMRNKRFWSRFVTAICGFAMVITAMAVVFPMHGDDSTQSQFTQTTTTTTEQQIDN